MRYFLIMTLPLFILSCSALNNGKIAPGYFQAYELMKSIISDTNDEISWNKIEKIPYASILLRARDRERKLISKIDSALRRIDDGSYGYCQETDEPINLKRLEARPIASLSLDAQEKHERMEKIHRDE